MGYLLTIIIPTYNSSRYVVPLLKKLSLSVENCVQVCVIDDGSIDDTKEKILKLNLPKNVSIYFNKHSGVSAARNFGIEIAQGKYITFLDADDTIDLKNLTLILNILKNKNKDILIFDSQIFGEKLFSVKEYKYLFIGYKKKKSIVSPGVHSKFYNLKVIKEQNVKFDDKLIIGEDVIFNISAILNVEEVYLSNLHFYNYQQPHTVTKFNSYYLENELYFQKILDNILTGFDKKEYVISYYRINGAISLVENFYSKQKLSRKLILNANEILKANQYSDYLGNNIFNNILLSREKKIIKELLKHRIILGSILAAKLIDYLRNFKQNN